MNDAYVTPSESAKDTLERKRDHSLVLSLIVCVPGLSLIAVILGFVGTTRRPVARRGRGMAIAGVVLGLLVVAWIGIGIVGYRAVDAFGGSIVFVIKAPTETMKAAFNDDFAAVQGSSSLAALGRLDHGLGLGGSLRCVQPGRARFGGGPPRGRSSSRCPTPSSS